MMEEDDTARVFNAIVAPLEAQTKTLVMERLATGPDADDALVIGGVLFALGRVLGGLISAGVSSDVLSSVDAGWEAVRAAGDSAAAEADEVPERFDA